MTNQLQHRSDFSTSQVPSSAKYSGWHIALVIIGGTISIPGFLMAANIGASLGLQTAAVAFVSGCFVLGVLAALTGLCGQKSGLSAYMLCEFAFGRWGGRFASFVVACSLIGWFGVISTIFAKATDLLATEVFAANLPIELYVVFGGVLIVAVTISGFKGIDKLAMALVPLMTVFLLLAAWLSIDDVGSWISPSGAEDMSLAIAISAVIGSYIAGVTIQPDYSRFAASRRGALVSAFIALGISFPLVLLCTAIPAVALGEADLFKVMFALGIGIPAFLLLLLAAWSSNVLCVYSASLSLATIFPGFPLRTIVIAIGVVGTGLALLHVDEYLTQYLVLLGITVPPISSIYIVDALLLRNTFDKQALSGRPRLVYRAAVAWITAVIFGYLSYLGVFSLTSIAAIDSIVVAGGLSLLLRPMDALQSVRNPEQEAKYDSPRVQGDQVS